MNKKNFAVNKYLYRLKALTENAMKKRVTRVILIGLLVFLVFFGKYFKEIFFIVLLVFLGSVSMLYNRVIRLPIGFELCTFACILSSVEYGAIIGAAVGVVSLFLAFVFSGQFQFKSFLSLFAMVLVAVVAFYLHAAGWKILYIGIVMTLMYDAIILPGYIFLGSTVIKSVIYFLTHMIINYWLFRDIAPVFEQIM